MNTVAILTKEIETMPEEYTKELLNFALFLKQKGNSSVFSKPEKKSMFGAFPGIKTKVERDEDRV